jgi:hypothetical protein
MGSCLMKKTRGRKSRVRVPLSCTGILFVKLLMLYFLTPINLRLLIQVLKPLDLSTLFWITLICLLCRMTQFLPSVWVCLSVEEFESHSMPPRADGKLEVTAYIAVR